MKNLKYILTALAVLGVVWLAKTTPIKNEVVDSTAQEKREICYLWYTEAGDTADLHMIFTGDRGQNVTGSFYFLPVEKDFKYGTFVGTAGPLDQNSMSRKATLLWQAKGEGVINTEELSIMFGDGSASIGFGEMKDRGDGVYVYADPEKISYSLNLQQKDCADSAIKS